MAYRTFTDALMQAKRASSLRGVPFSTRDVMNLHSGYMEGAGERVAAERSSDLAEKSLSSQEKNWTDTLAQEKELAGMSRAETARITGEQISAQNRAAQKTLYGNAISTGATLGGAALLMQPAIPTATQAAAAGGPAAGILADMGTAQAEAGHATVASPASAKLSGYAAPLLYVTAAEMVRRRSQLDKEYEDRGAFEKMGSAPVTGGPPALVEAIAPGSSGNALVKPMTAVAKAEEQLVGEPLDEFFSGNIDKGIAATVAGPVEAPKKFLESVGIDCIIVTACTDRHSPEVEIAREYRDAFLSRTDLRGYYAIGERVVPLLESNGAARRVVKKWLVDRLVDRGAVALGMKQKTSLRSSRLVSCLFLMLCSLIGMILPQYVRQNGEVY